MRAITHAHVILSWQENLPKTEMPPEWMWALDEPLEEWFEEVEAARDDRNNATRSSGRDTTVPMMSNSLAVGKKRGR